MMMDRSRPTVPPSSRRDPQQLSRQHQQYRDQISSDNNEDDPLAPYDQFVQWTLQNYGESDPDSGLLELLEETTRKFKDDASYKTDLRYLKLWSLYARQVEKPATIYSFLIINEIGTIYSALYEEYANALEQDGLFTEAEEVYLMGIKRNPRALGRLKSRFRDFQDRVASSRTIPEPSARSSTTEPKSALQLDSLRHNPLKNFNQTSSTNSPTFPLNDPSRSRYAPMLAPPAPGKRPEKLRFNLSLLFTEEGKEYSIQEARARSMGLLGKKWGPPPASELSHSTSSSVPVNFNDNNSKADQNTTVARRAVMMGEPTVTINTKEALADVFGMYNSPEKTRRIRHAPGSKHAPLKKVEPITPIVRQPSTQANSENVVHAMKTPTPAFRPFVEDDGRKENTTPAPKFKPFVDPDPPNVTPFTAPDHRRALSVKDHSSLPSNANENATRNAIKPSATPKLALDDGSSVFRKVFTPAAMKPPREVLKEDQSQLSNQPQAQVHDLLSPTPVPQHASRVSSVPNATVLPFGDAVFTRPPAQSQNAFTPRTSAFTPFSDSKAGLATSTPHFATEQRAPLWPLNMVEPEDEEDDQDEGHDLEDYQPAGGDRLSADGDGYEDVDSFQAVPLGGRFGQFNVMTPITERTFEFTNSTRGSVSSTPHDYSMMFHGEKTPGQQDEYDAIQTAERLATELREDDMRAGYDLVEDSFEESDSSFASTNNNPPPPSSSGLVNGIRAKSGGKYTMEYIEEKTGTLSLIDAMTLSSNFKPPNPCNPFDPPIVLTLLSLVPSDKEYHDFRDREAKKLDPLQRFAKRARKTSSETNSTGVLSLTSNFSLTLGERRFSVLQKLGEGGFGAVFQARDLSSRCDSDGDEEDEDEDEDGPPMAAIKVVKPRNIWEYHVLRRLHFSLPQHLRRSVVSPHALYAFRDESFLILDLCAQGTLLDVVNNAGSAGVSQQGACLDELLVMFFSIELLRLLEGIHNAGFIHGDLKIDNCLLRLEDVPGEASTWSSLYQPSGEGGWGYKGIKLIDFGRMVDTRLFPPSQKFIAEWPTDDRDCLEMRENRPWTFHPDYFGLAGIIYCMLFGKYIQSSSVTSSPSGADQRFKIATPFKRYWQNDLWNRLFDLLLNPSLVRLDGHLPLCEELGTLRKEMETWLQRNCNRSTNTLKGLLKKVEVSVWRGSTR